MIADDFKILEDTKDIHVHKFADNAVIYKIKKHYESGTKELTADKILEGIVAKIEQTLPKFDKLRINEKEYPDEGTKKKIQAYTSEYLADFFKNVKSYNNEMPQILPEKFEENYKRKGYTFVVKCPSRIHE